MHFHLKIVAFNRSGSLSESNVFERASNALLWKSLPLRWLCFHLSCRLPKPVVLSAAETRSLPRHGTARPKATRPKATRPTQAAPTGDFSSIFTLSGYVSCQFFCFVPPGMVRAVDNHTGSTLSPAAGGRAEKGSPRAQRRQHRTGVGQLFHRPRGGTQEEARILSAVAQRSDTPEESVRIASVVGQDRLPRQVALPGCFPLLHHRYFTTERLLPTTLVNPRPLPFSFLAILPRHPSSPSFLAILPRHPSSPSFLAILPRHPSSPSFLAILPRHPSSPIRPRHPASPSGLAIRPRHPASPSGLAIRSNPSSMFLIRNPVIHGIEQYPKIHWARFSQNPTSVPIVPPRDEEEPGKPSWPSPSPNTPLLTSLPRFLTTPAWSPSVPPQAACMPSA